MHDQQLDLDGCPVGRAYRVTIKARRPAPDTRPEDDPAIKASGHEETKLTYAVRAQTWREAIDKAMDLYPKTDEDGTKYSVEVAEG